MQRNKKQCIYCDAFISLSNYSRHIQSHIINTYVNPDTIYHVDHEGLLCKFCNKLCKNKNSLVQHELRCNCNINRLSPIISPNFTNKGLKPWNYGLSADTDDRICNAIQTRKENHMLGLHKDQSGENNPACNPIVRYKISQTCLKKSSVGEWHNSLAKIRYYMYKGYSLHGTWELKYAIYLDTQNIRWEKNMQCFPYVFNNTVHYYTPDFYLLDLDEYIEIKGYIRPDGREYAKWMHFPKDKVLRVLKEDDLKQLGVLDIDISDYTI